MIFRSLNRHFFRQKSSTGSTVQMSNQTGISPPRSLKNANQYMSLLERPLFNAFHLWSDRLTFSNEVGGDFQVLCSTQCLCYHRFTLLPDQSSESTHQEAGNELYRPRIWDQTQDMIDIVPSSKSVEKLAGPLNPITDIFNAKELKE